MRTFELGAEPNPLPTSRPMTGDDPNAALIAPSQEAQVTAQRRGGISMADALAQAEHLKQAEAAQAAAVPHETQARAWLRSRSSQKAMVEIVSRLIALEEIQNGK
jgi:hypothetical protein